MPRGYWIKPTKYLFLISSLCSKTLTGYAILTSPTLLVTPIYFYWELWKGAHCQQGLKGWWETWGQKRQAQWQGGENSQSELMGWQRFCSILAAERFILVQSGVSFSVCSCSTISSILSIILCFLHILHSSLLCPSLRLSYLQTLEQHLICLSVSDWVIGAI